MTIKILIADDHDVVRAGLKAMFEKSDIRIIAEASDGIAAFKLAKKHRPNLVLLDVRMPAGDGLTCLGRLRLDLPEISVVMFSAFDNPTYVKAVERIVAAGRRHKKGLGFMAASEDWARSYKKLGFNMLAAGPDQALLAAGMRSILASVADK